MADQFRLEIVSPERLLADRSVASVVVPGTDGDFGVLPGHAPMLSTLRPGVVEISEHDGAVPDRLFVKGGLAQVDDTSLTLLAEETIDLNNVDAAILEKQMADTREDIEDAKDDVERAVLEKELGWMTALSDVIS